MMGISSAIFAWAAATLTGFSLWGRISVGRRLAELTGRYKHAESERSRLERQLAACHAEHGEHLGRLEHDLRSSIGVIVGFSSILIEQAEGGRSVQPSLVLKGANAIHQSAQNSLRILEAAAELEPGKNHRQVVVVERGC
jgi:signal transduction histidine kinase